MVRLIKKIGSFLSIKTWLFINQNMFFIHQKMVHVGQWLCRDLGNGASYWGSQCFIAADHHATGFPQQNGWLPYKGT